MEMDSITIRSGEGVLLEETSSIVASHITTWLSQKVFTVYIVVQEDYLMVYTNIPSANEKVTRVTSATTTTVNN